MQAAGMTGHLLRLLVHQPLHALDALPLDRLVLVLQRCILLLQRQEGC